MLARIDLNSDMGERDSAEGLALDAELMPLITSVNIACGGHAGSDDLMRRTARLAARHAVAIGAHPGFPDRSSFGRREQHLPARDIESLMLEQVHRLLRVLESERLTLSHVKPHGALYSQAASEPLTAQAVVNAVLRLDHRLRLYALAGSALARAAQQAGLPVAQEAFADRAYQADGMLVPRTDLTAVLEHDDEVRRQLHGILEGSVTCADGSRLCIQAETLCLHSDTPRSVALGRLIRRELTAAGVLIARVPDGQ